MEVSLYNSTVCRLCGEENDHGSLLYSGEENNQNLCELINAYLPIKVSDDGQLPRTICPGCTIQLEATVEFLNLIINGQKVLRQLHLREQEYKKNAFGNPSKEVQIVTETVIYEKTGDTVYPDDHPMSLQVGGLSKPKRKRGRPPKKNKPPEAVVNDVSKPDDKEVDQGSTEELNGKRRRKTPTRFKEVIQGKELERIFIEEGVTDGEESDSDSKQEIKPEAIPPVPKEPEVIGHMENSGELVVVVKGKGRGRPKGRLRQTREECAICGMEFSCVGRYMSHVAQHGPVLYQCSQCLRPFTTRLLFKQHQEETQHTGQNIIPCDDNPNVDKKSATVQETNRQNEDPLATNTVIVNNAITQELPDLNPIKIDDDQSTDVVKNEIIDGTEPNDVTPVEGVGGNDNEDVKIIDESPNKEGVKGKTKLKCNHCDKEFSSKQSRSLHNKAVHLGEKPYVCGSCGARFAYPRSLALHSLAHRRAPPTRGYACDLCGKVLNHPSSVVYHKEAEHAGQRYVCGKCGKSFKHKQLLQRHQLVHSQLRPYTCKTCNSSFKTKANLLNHSLLHTGVKKFSCEICKHKFAHKTSLTLHMRWHTGQKPFSCGKCGKSFSQKGNLSEHERIHTGEKPYECNVCHRRFTTSSQHRLHARRHANDKPYACTHCGKRFASRASWAAHARREAGAGAGTGAGAFSCGVCSRGFSERWALRKHMRRHTGERPHRCPHCPKAFADASNLNKHKKQVHKQISLLVKEQGAFANGTAMAGAGTVVPTGSLLTPGTLAPGTLIPAGTLAPAQQLAAVESEEDDDERVIYVAYDVGDETPGYHILGPEQAAGLEMEQNEGVPDSGGGGGGPLYAGGSLLQQLQMRGHSSTEDHLPVSCATPLSHTLKPEVTDEEGNPLHFTMEDGTQLAITLADGKSLQIVTQDGQTIPVEINRYTEEVEEEVDATEIVQQFNVQKGNDASEATPVTHYFTIV